MATVIGNNKDMALLSEIFSEHPNTNKIITIFKSLDKYSQFKALNNKSLLNTRLFKQNPTLLSELKKIFGLKLKFKPNDKCFCGSGRKFKNCYKKDKCDRVTNDRNIGNVSGIKSAVMGSKAPLLDSGGGGESKSVQSDSSSETQYYDYGSLSTDQQVLHFGPMIAQHIGSNQYDEKIILRIFNESTFDTRRFLIDSWNERDGNDFKKTLAVIDSKGKVNKELEKKYNVLFQKFIRHHHMIEYDIILKTLIDIDSLMEKIRKKGSLNDLKKNEMTKEVAIFTQVFHTFLSENELEWSITPREIFINTLKDHIRTGLLTVSISTLHQLLAIPRGNMSMYHHIVKNSYISDVVNLKEEELNGFQEMVKQIFNSRLTDLSGIFRKGVDDEKLLSEISKNSEKIESFIRDIELKKPIEYMKSAHFGPIPLAEIDTMTTILYKKQNLDEKLKKKFMKENEVLLKKSLSRFNIAISYLLNQTKIEFGNVLEQQTNAIREKEDILDIDKSIILSIVDPLKKKKAEKEYAEKQYTFNLLIAESEKAFNVLTIQKNICEKILANIKIILNFYKSEESKLKKSKLQNQEAIEIAKQNERELLKLLDEEEKKAKQIAQNEKAKKREREANMRSIEMRKQGKRAKEKFILDSESDKTPSGVGGGESKKQIPFKPEPDDAAVVLTELQKCEIIAGGTGPQNLFQNGPQPPLSFYRSLNIRNGFKPMKKYIECVLNVLRANEGLSLTDEEEEQKMAVKLFEKHKSEMASLVSFINNKDDIPFLFVVVGGAAVKAHHSTGRRAGHKTTDFDVKVYPLKPISEDQKGKWVAEARFKIYRELRLWSDIQRKMSKEFKFDVLKGSRTEAEGRYTSYCEHRDTWQDDLEQPLCIDPTIPIKVSLETESKYFPLLEFSFSPSETLTKDKDYAKMQMPGTDVPLTYLTLQKLKEILKENITKGDGFLARIAAREPNVYRKKILSWLKQINSLQKVESRANTPIQKERDGASPTLSSSSDRDSPVDFGEGGGESKKATLSNPFDGLTKAEIKEIRRKYKLVNMKDFSSIEEFNDALGMIEKINQYDKFKKQKGKGKTRKIYRKKYKTRNKNKSKTLKRTHKNKRKRNKKSRKR